MKNNYCNGKKEQSKKSGELIFWTAFLFEGKKKLAKNEMFVASFFMFLKVFRMSFATTYFRFSGLRISSSGRTKRPSLRIRISSK